MGEDQQQQQQPRGPEYSSRPAQNNISKLTGLRGNLPKGATRVGLWEETVWNLAKRRSQGASLKRAEGQQCLRVQSTEKSWDSVVNEPGTKGPVAACFRGHFAGWL